MARKLAAQENSTLIAADDRPGDVIGFVAVGASRDDDGRGTVGELTAIYARPEHWGAGVGTCLRDAALRRARDPRGGAVAGRATVSTASV